MSLHDIIDNRNEKLVDHINLILASIEAARFGAGAFFPSGPTPFAERLASVKDLRLLVGNATNREALEQQAHSYRRLEIAAEAGEAQALPKRAQGGCVAAQAGGSVPAKPA